MSSAKMGKSLKLAKTLSIRIFKLKTTKQWMLTFLGWGCQSQTTQMGVPTAEADFLTVVEAVIDFFESCLLGSQMVILSLCLHKAFPLCVPVS